jgi:hypothetical protein
VIRWGRTPKLKSGFSTTSIAGAGPSGLADAGNEIGTPVGSFVDRNGRAKVAAAVRTTARTIRMIQDFMRARLPEETGTTAPAGRDGRWDKSVGRSTVDTARS